MRQDPNDHGIRRLRRLLPAADLCRRPLTSSAIPFVIPDHLRRELEQHAVDEAPNEACGLIVCQDGRAIRYERGRNRAASPYRFELDIGPEIWFLEDEHCKLAVFHSHPTGSARPSRTDIANVGLWVGRPYVILSRATGELAAWRIVDGRAEPLTLATA